MFKIKAHTEDIRQNWDIPLLFRITELYGGTCLFTSEADESKGMNITGINPVITITENEVHYGNSSEKADPLTVIDRLTEMNLTEDDLPLLLGYIAYDYKDRLEERGLYSDVHEREFPEIYFTVFEHYIITDNSDPGSLHSIRLEFPFEYRRTDISAVLGTEAPEVKEKHSLYMSSSLSRDRFKSGADTIKEYVKAGDIYQANLTRKITGKTAYTPFELAMKLRSSNNIGFGVFAYIEGKYIISTTPERFFRIENGILSAEPVKGTVRRSGDTEEDRRLLNQLNASGKDKAELAMIVDLLRNDMNRICSEVSVEGFPVTMELKNVYHLYSLIKGKLNTDKFSDMIRALFPAGSITGCPKIRACQIIEELEGTGRGPYTGNFGYINFNGSCDFNIMIRTLFYDRGSISFNAGGGITLLSDPEEEFRETIYKAKNIYEAVNMEEVWEERYCLKEK